MSVRQISQAFRESMTGPTLNIVAQEFDNLVAQINAAFRGIGSWSSLVYVAANFAGKAAMVWTTQAANQVTFEFIQFGGSGYAGGATMVFHLHLVNTTVGGTLSNALNVAVPNNSFVLSECSGSFSYRDNGTFGTGVWEALPATSTVNFYKADKSNWAASSSATDIRATVVLSVS